MNLNEEILRIEELNLEINNYHNKEIYELETKIEIRKKLLDEMNEELNNNPKNKNLTINMINIFLKDNNQDELYLKKLKNKDKIKKSIL